MRALILIITCILVASCSAVSKDIPDDRQIYCKGVEKPKPEPLEGGLGGTGLIQQNNCIDSKAN